jgi:soluble lytic murein transglycosylase
VRPIHKTLSRIALVLALAHAPLFGAAATAHAQRPELRGEDDCLCSRAPGDDAPSWSSAESVVARMSGIRTLHARSPSTPSATPHGVLALPDDAASAALVSYRAHLAAEEWSEAAVALETARTLAPSLADRFALMRGELELRTGATSETCGLFERAIESPTPTVAAHARVDRVRCLFAIDDPHAESELAALRRRYRDLPEARRLELDRAASLERQGEIDVAIQAYDAIDRAVPGSPEAADARAALARLAEAGHARPALSPLEEVDRLERLARSGPPDLARVEAERLHALVTDVRLGSRVTLVLARLARVEGRFDDTAALLREARALDPNVGEDPTAVAAQATDLAEAARGREQEEAREDLRRLGYRNAASLRRASTMHLVSMARVAARAGLAEETTALASETARRTTTLCPTRLDVAILASGTADDDALATLLEPCIEGTTPRAIAARYHRARALERAGRQAEAEAQLAEVAATDVVDARIYAVLAAARLEAAHPTLAPAPLLAEDDAAKEDDAPDDEAPAPSLDVLASLDALAAQHGQAFPWLARAADLVRLGDREAAADELFQAYEAWAESVGRAAMRAGLEAVYRNAAAPRVPTTPELHRARRLLTEDERALLADIAEAIGDAGLAVRFEPARADTHPRPYPEIVEAAAARHGLDPNLVWAVMRVESIYNPRIISYAGAIGLLQIMPRTGRLIAHQMGNDDFTVDDLLDPATNIEMAAWYLSSLIRRFEGRIPLAVAAYNGGPHNVRRWMADHGRAMPVDALCERIPFEQTHRYVRRVLSHYAAYRRDAGLPPATLELDLPALGPDTTAF